MDETFKYIKEGEFERRNHLLEQFQDNGIEKAISQEEFDTKFEKHSVFSGGALSKYVNDRKENEGDTEEVLKSIQNEFEALTKVVVKTDRGFEARFVKAPESEDVEKGEVDHNGGYGEVIAKALTGTDIIE